MKNSYNVLIRSNYDCDGLTEAIINEFNKKYESVSGIVIDCNTSARKRDARFEYISSKVISDVEIDELHSSSKALSGYILNKMLPYKSMAMHMMMRALHYDVFDRKYLEDLYYAFLKYWNEVLDNRKIECALFMVLPHHGGEYILYALCKAKGIKTVVLNPRLEGDGSLYDIGYSIESLGCDIGKNYVEGVLDDEDEVSDYLKEVVANTLKNNVIGMNSCDRLKKEYKKLVYKTISLKTLSYNILVLLYYVIHRRVSDVGKRKMMIKWIIKARRHERKMDHYREYDKLVSVWKISNDEKYIYFPLQMQPEASTMPQAGEFKNQILSLELLSEAIGERNIKIYVKEHWVQYNRERGFYKTISKIPNVKIVNRACNSLELIENSLLVATQTGNCLFEALIKKKPAIAIGNGYTYKNAPNITEVYSSTEIANVIDKILAGDCNITDIDIQKYLIAMDKGMVFSYLDSLDEASSYYDRDETANKIVEFAGNI